MLFASSVDKFKGGIIISTETLHYLWCFLFSEATVALNITYYNKKVGDVHEDCVTQYISTLTLPLRELCSNCSENELGILYPIAKAPLGKIS